MTLPYPARLADGDLVLRLSTPDDVATITGWLADPAVHRWWGGEPVPAAEVRRKYCGAREPAVAVYVLEFAQDPVGLVQAWQDPDARGLDAFLAAGHQGRGLGPRAARLLAVDLLARGWRGLTVDPAVDNPRAQAAWRRAGFVPTGERGLDDGYETVLMEFRGEP
ncbi:GNAT family N-acetyltransferase [Kineococcus rhizosphaerae]|uniref:Lysine N-acyltransferase MbtK n=1 Tax=Kineococcus rhizosphaerae TaxID=559628 RepID=A0A2T0R1Z8_9ACTN|nr:GNAT family N-acetyltransferase [Kineococcus rhizosphaerae]PRY13533.1 aminoglycoside 6'-N-acetyltransferase [Kineococcus rhizosphaerae]